VKTGSWRTGVTGGRTDPPGGARVLAHRGAGSVPQRGVAADDAVVMGATSIWRNRDFVRLWAASTVSVFGSLITRTALPFAAILVLGTGPLEIGAIRSFEIVGGLVVGLAAGAWVIDSGDGR
jgi:hypothetical protein